MCGPFSYTVSESFPEHRYEALLTEILFPTVTEGHGLLRAELMAAFQGGNHLRSLGDLQSTGDSRTGE